jgi:hypothetical protein
LSNQDDNDSAQVRRLHATTDAAVWAAEFMALFGSRLEDIDEGLMIGWFANAIEVGRAAGEKPYAERGLWPDG